MHKPTMFYHKISKLRIGKTEIKKGIYYSDHSHYQDILHCFIQEYPSLKNINKWLLIAHESDTGDILVNEEFSVAMRGQPKRQNKSKGDMIAFHKEFRNFHSYLLPPTKRIKSHYPMKIRLSDTFHLLTF